jgi:hypothetical protein
MTCSASLPAASIVYQIPIAQLESYRGCGLIVRSAHSSMIASRLGADDLANLAYVQLTSLRSDPDALIHWADGLPIELLLDDPALDFAFLYRYAKLRDNHPVRVLLPVTTGFEKAVRLACSLQFEVRLNIGQPSAPMVEQLVHLLHDYLHRSTISQPIEFFHSMLLGLCRREPVSLWAIQEEDPALIRHVDEQGDERSPGRLAEADLGPDPAGFVERWSRSLVAEGAECAKCPFVSACRGYFKWPQRDYDCTYVKTLLHTLRRAADELRGDLAAIPPHAGASPP